jgi:hypothetical protein
MATVKTHTEVFIVISRVIRFSEQGEAGSISAMSVLRYQLSDWKSAMQKLIQSNVLLG